MTAIKQKAQVSFSLVSQMMGASLLSISFIVHELGAILSAVVFITVYIAVIYLLNTYTEVVHYTQSKSYIQLTKNILGKKMSILLNFCLIVSYYGFCTGYVIIASHSLTSFIINITGKTFNSYVSKAVISLCLIFPLCLIRSIGVLSKVTTISSMIIFLTVVSIVVLFFVKLREGEVCKIDGASVPYQIKALPDKPGWLTFLTFLMYIPSIQSNFGSQNVIPSLLNDLQGPPVFKKRIIKFSLGVAITCATVFYALVGYFGSTMFGDQIQSNIFINLTACNILYFNVLALFYALVVIISFPLVLFPIKETLLQMMNLSIKTKKGYTVSAVISLIFVVLSFALAAVYENIVVIFGIFASLSGFIYIFCLPIIFTVKLPQLKEKNKALDFAPDAEHNVDPVIVPILSNFMSTERARTLSLKIFGVDNSIPEMGETKQRGVSFLKMRTISVMNHPSGPIYRRTITNGLNVIAEAATAVNEVQEEEQVEIATCQQEINLGGCKIEQKLSRSRVLAGGLALGMSVVICTVGVVMNFISMVNSFK